MVRCTTVP